MPQGPPWQKLEATLAVAQHPLKIYAGYIYCKAEGNTRVDEAYLLLSAELVQRVLATPDLRCGGHAGITTGWWFTKDKPLNQLGDVQWISDPRLDNLGGVLKNSPTELRKVCSMHIGVHHTYPNVVLDLWEAAKLIPEHSSDDSLYGNSLWECNCYRGKRGGD